MECLEFRRIVGADPQRPGSEALEHAAGCSRCARFLRQTLVLDERIRAALEVPVPPESGDRVRPATGSGVPGMDRRRWYALAASIVAGVLVGTLLWVSGPRDSLAEDLVQHLAHEPQALVVSDVPENARTLGRVLDRGGVRLRPEAGTVSYANSCLFRRHVVPHFVVQTDDGPVTVMVLRHEQPDGRVAFSEDGYAGTIVPAGPGSIAVIGPANVDLEQVTARVLAAVEWRQD